METLVVEAGRLLIANGILGIVVLAEAYVIFRMWKYIGEQDDEHKAEIAAKDKLIAELNENRLSEVKVGYDIAKSVQATLDTFLIAVRRK